MYWLSRRAPKREYSGSSNIKLAAVWIESLSSSRVVAPSYKPLIVFVAIRITSTFGRFGVQREIARTILFMSTGSCDPFRLRTRIVVWVVSSVRRAAVLEVCPMYVSMFCFNFLVRISDFVDKASPEKGVMGKDSSARFRALIS